MIFKYIFILFLLAPIISQAKLSVITTTTDIKWMVEKIGGDKVTVESLLSGTEDPHFVDAMPHFVAKVANADVFCFVGLDLEVGWAPKVLMRSGNKKLQSGGSGYCETGRAVKALGVPAGKIDRSHGDVHASGNPHYHLSPTAFLQGASTVLKTLMAVDSKNSQHYKKQFESLKKELNSIKKEVKTLLNPLKGRNFLEYHKEFTYFLKEYGLINAGAVERVPGVPPSAGRLARVTVKAKDQKIYAVLATTTSPKGILKKMNEMSQIPILRLPLSLLPKPDLSTYRQHQLYLAKKILEVQTK